ncbi:uncharacterized protein LOC126388283 isoform X4 [Epinephelus moara]|uniref:uncharacterized protein LOC126388283 isoform X4 n=1 Tax=Epinephelus moara TaxID=300413 RepID=UPI00214E3E35|nr:uncharacterized protein LOC126388283 isoform X4 [Epinephelus moara]
MSNWEETSGLPQDTLEGLHCLAGLGTPRGSLGRADGSGWGEDCLGFFAEAAAPATRTRISGGRRRRRPFKTPKMSLKIFETKWKTALTSILEELTEPQFRKLMFNLGKIPQGVKMDKTREEIPYIIIQYYGTEGSISVIDKEMKQLPRNDAAVQEHLRPFVEKLKKQRQKEKKTTTKNESASGLVAKKQKPAAVTMSKPAADSGSVAKKRKPAAETISSSVSALGSVSKKQKPAAVTMSKLAADLGSVAKKQKPAADHVGVVKPKQKTEKPAESTKTSQVQSAPVQTGRIKILRLKMSNKTNTHLEVEFNNQMQTFFITTRLLANTLGFRADDDLALRLLFELPLTADAKIQGNKIVEMKKV